MKPTLRRAPREAGSRLFRTDEASAGDGEARAGVGGLGVRIWSACGWWLWRKGRELRVGLVTRRCSQIV